MNTTALCLRTQWSNPRDSFFRSGHVCGDEGQANYMAVELFVDGRLNSCPRNPFMILAWCVKIAKKTQQPSLVLCTTKVKFSFSWPQERRRAHDLLDTSLLEADPESSAGERPRAHRGACTRARCENSGKDSDCVESKSSCMCEWRRSLGWLETIHIPNSRDTTIVCEPAPHRSCALHSHRLLVPIPPHWRTTARASETPHTKKRRRESSAPAAPTVKCPKHLRL